MKKLIFVMNEKEPDTKHICNREGCPFFGDNKICNALWSTPPSSSKSRLASMCNYYDTQNVTIMEVDESLITEINEAMTYSQTNP